MQSSPNDDLVLYKGDVSPIATGGETPDQLLLHAASQGDVAWAQELLSQGASPTARSKDAKTALISASVRGHHAVATLLLHHGADINAVDQDGMTALHHASSKGNVQVVELLLQNKAKLNLTCQLGRTPLHLAASSAGREVVQLLLNAGAWVGPQDELGWRPLHHAAWKGNAEVVELLLAKGASPNVVDKLARLPADVARSDDVRVLLTTAQEARELTKWHQMAARVVAGEALNFLLHKALGQDALSTPQGKYYTGWVVRHADWIRTQSTPNLRLATPQLPIHCLEVAKKVPGLNPGNVMQRANVQELLHDGSFREGVAVFDSQMRGLYQLLALPNTPITWAALAAGKLIPSRVLTPPALWAPPRRLFVPGSILKWLVVQALRKGSGHLLLTALVMAAGACPPDLVPRVQAALEEHLRNTVQAVQGVGTKVMSRIKRNNKQVTVVEEQGAEEAEADAGAAAAATPSVTATPTSPLP